ncbi:MAG TPA: type II and III secretion system protein [Burkholderiales bacterium]
MKLGKSVALGLGALLLVACGQQPIKPSEAHMQAGDPAPAGAIPPAVQMAPILPAPQPTARPETYSVVVNNVRLQELLFALARDARINVDIHPDVSGTVTLNAIDQTLPQLLARIARQVDMRYEMHGDNLLIMRDSPFLRTYRIDYLSATRNVKMQSTASTQFGTTGAGGAGAGTVATATGATAQIDVTAENKLWESVVQNVRDILKETDRVPAAVAAAPVPQPQPAQGAPGTPPSAPPQPAVTYQDAASVIGNRESGILYVRATSRQHERIQEFLDQVLAGARRQVLVEATVAEVQLRNEYQRGIEWQRLRSGASGFELLAPGTPQPAGFNTLPFVISYASASNNFLAAVALLEQFGDVRVLSSPKLSVLNNQTAILRVTRDIIYFTITPSTQPITIAGGGGGTTVEASFTTTPNVAAEGFMMTVLPFINENDAIVLNVKPTIRRRVDSAIDPNPALQGGTPNTIPVFETREFDSILRLRSGEIAVLAGLMQDSINNRDIGIPGIRSIPILGELLSQRDELSTKTELVIFLRATVIRDPSLEGDFQQFRTQVPREDFFSKPNPGKVAPPVGPSGGPMR